MDGPGDGYIAIGLVSLAAIIFFVAAAHEEEERKKAPKPKTFWDKLLSGATPKQRSKLCKKFGDDLDGCK